MRLSLLSFWGMVFLASCATVRPKKIDATGKNNLERGLWVAMGLDENDDEKYLKKPDEVDSAEDLSKQVSSEASKDEGSKSSDLKSEAVASEKESSSEATVAVESAQPKPSEEVMVAELPTPETLKPASGGVNSKLAPRPNPFKERVPGVLMFVSQDTQVQSTNFELLNKLANRLKENPQETLVLQGQFCDGEAFELVEARYRNILKYMQAQDIDSNRVVLDDKRIAGDWPEFRMFLLKN